MRPPIPSTSVARLLGALLLASPASLLAQSTWLGGGADANWSTAANWDTPPVLGSNVTFGTGFASGVNLNYDLALANLGSITFNTTLPTGGITLSGGALTTTGGLINNNATVGRNVTISNNLVINAPQTWTSAITVTGGVTAATTVLAGNLSGSATITLGTTVASNAATLPAWRLGGNNSAYTGTITTVGADSFGVLLLSPLAQTGGLVDLNSGNRNLWLTTNSSANPYTFWTGIATPTPGNPMNVNFRNAGTSGLYLTGGDVFWNPVSSGNHYLWDAARAGSNSEIRLNGSNDSATAPAVAPPRMLFFGNSSGSLVLGGNRSITNGAGGGNPARVTMNFALSDDGTARQFTTSAGLMVLTRAAGGGDVAPNLGGVTRVTGGALAMSAMDQVFNGWLELNAGVALLDGISWAQFTADRTAGYRASAGADSWGITGAGGGFAARGSDVTIFIDANPAATYGTITAGAVFNRDFTIGSAARANDGSLYANRSVVIAQETVLTANRTINVLGGNMESTTNWTMNSPIHEFSGKITGSFLLNLSGNDRSNPRNGTLRLSNIANDFAGLRVNSTSGSGTGGGGGVVVLATDDAVLGLGSPVYIGTGGSGAAGMLLLENQGVGVKTFSKALQIDIGADASSGDSGFGSWAGDVRYDGTVTITGSNRNSTPVHVQAGRLSFGAAAAFNNSSTAGVHVYNKGGAGEIDLTNLNEAAGTNANWTWIHRQGTIVTSSASNQLVGGTGAFDGDNVFGNDGATWPQSTGSLTGIIPVDRAWRVTSADQSYTSLAMAYAGYTTIEIETGRTLTVSTGANATSPSEARGNGNTTPRWDLIKKGGGTWVFSNTDLSVPASSGPQNGAGFIRVDAGTLDITGDYGRGSLSLNGGTILTGAFSPFTYGSSTQPFGLGVGQVNIFEITSAGGKLGLSASATGTASRAGGINSWDQSLASTVTFAARDNFNLVFANANFPDVTALTTLAIERDGSGNGLVQVNDTSVNVSGSLSGTATLRVGAAGTGALNLTGTLAPGPGPATLDLEAALTLGAASTFAAQIGGGTPGDGASFYDQVNVANATGSVTLDSTATLSLAVINGYVPTGSDVFYVLTRADAGAFGTTFSGAPEGGTVFLAGGYQGTITYLANWAGTQAGSVISGGNDVAIYNVVPEPGSAAVLLGGLALLGLRRRRD